jgi:C-terminal processing protease CtpA/Prc
MAEVKLTGRHGLAAVRPIDAFRKSTEDTPLTAADRTLLVDQATDLIDGVYVHLLHKRAMYAIEPSQRLRLLRHRLPQLTDAQFHAELLRVFIELRDLHTNYILPAPYQGPFAFLGILLEQYWADGTPKWLVSKVFENLTGDPNLTAGVEVTHWNGSPIALAVARVANLEAGSNTAARTARGLENMTLRTLAMSQTPDEDWVELTYKVGRKAVETRLPWRVFDSAQDVFDFGTRPASKGPKGTAAPEHLRGLDLRTELVRQVKKTLFAPQAVREARRVGAAAKPPAPTADQAAAGIIPTTRPEELKARTVQTRHGTYGHLRIFTFNIAETPGVEDNISAFLNEVARLLSIFPRDGLIVDVRGNGGGYVIAAEFLLQFLTPRRVQPEPMQFISNQTTAQLCAAVSDLGGWLPSIQESTETGAQYSSALPLYPEDVVNSAGQLYHGPVVLITDALCYSATDIFSAGFADHEIGPVLGVDDNTGAGGANVWEHGELRSQWPAGPFVALPGGAQFRVALRRSLRVGKRSGEPVEDLGVLPDVRHHLTRRDLLEDNADLMEYAGELLKARTPRRLDAEVVSRTPSEAVLSLTTQSVQSIDVYRDGRPATTVPDLAAGTTEVHVPLAGEPPATVRIEGFDRGALVAARTVTV